MKRFLGIALAALCAVGGVIGFRLLIWKLPVPLGGAEWDSIAECADNQKNLYQSLAYYVQEHNGLPKSAEDFRIHGFPAAYVWKCPASQRGYVLHLENYGNSNAVLIADEEALHPTNWKWRLRGLTPQVQTMGDGTIQLFKDGKVATMNGRRKNKPAIQSPGPNP